MALSQAKEVHTHTHTYTHSIMSMTDTHSHIEIFGIFDRFLENCTRQNMVKVWESTFSLYLAKNTDCLLLVWCTKMHKT